MSKQRVLLALLASIVLVVGYRFACSAASKTKNPRHSNDPAIAAKSQLASLGKSLQSLSGQALGTIEVRGQVRQRGSSKPVADAEVKFWGIGGESSVFSNSQGYYEITMSPGLYRAYAEGPSLSAVGKVQPQRIPTTASADDVAMPNQGVASLVGLFRNHPRLDFEVVSTQKISGVVVDHNGMTISNALVVSSGSQRLITGSDLAISDDEGQFEVDLPLGQNRLVVSHEDFVGKPGGHALWVDPENTQHLQLAMDGGCIISGFVVDEDGHRVGDGSFEREEGGSFAPVAPIRAGRFRYAVSETGTLRLRAWPWASPPSETQEFYCSQGVRHKEIVFAIPDKAPALSGTLRDDSGNPASHVFIDLFPFDSATPGQQERSNEHGEFAFYELPEGPVQLSVYVPLKGAAVQLIDVPSSGVAIELGGIGSLVGNVSSDAAEMQMRFRCVFEIQGDTALRDNFSMPWRDVRVPLQRGAFRVYDLPACPMEISLLGQGISATRKLELKADVDNQLIIP